MKIFVLGSYCVNLTNDAGERSISMQLKVLDVPGPVRNLEVEDVTANKCTVIWDPPAEDGGSDICRGHKLQPMFKIAI